MAAAKRKVDKKDTVYSLLVINKTTRFSLFVASCIVYVLVFLNVTAMMSLGQDWTVIVWSSTLFAGLLGLLPRSENWRYAPWQKRAQKYEYHYVD
jgi:hypothetical protein